MQLPAANGGVGRVSKRHIDIKQLGHNVIEMNLKGVQHNIRPYMEASTRKLNISKSLRLISAKSECADIFHQSFLCCYAILISPKEGETAVYGYNPALFFEFFRCRVDVLQS